jgi:hypothetical protein
MFQWLLFKDGAIARKRVYMPHSQKTRVGARQRR